MKRAKALLRLVHLQLTPFDAWSPTKLQECTAQVVIAHEAQTGGNLARTYYLR